MSQVLKRLKEANLELPVLSASSAKFKPYIISGNHIYISGQLPLGFGEISEHVGQLGNNCTIERGSIIAKIVALNILYQAYNACNGDLDKIKRCVKITVFVNSAPSFTDQPIVANAISEIMLLAFGERGEHARSAIGVAQLPFGVAVEAEAIFEI
ncbi:MAG: RidA family protein [Candidatus Midichloriaceae bacterium]|jgi:enamine deaminase RidA (YjgF/YER057c/UK114 family)|nr:RidA family protein [Candidatus Midichloriaceae bacterium]